jgi:lipopolysaccharide transport system ATP-binding protein
MAGLAIDAVGLTKRYFVPAPHAEGADRGPRSIRRLGRHAAAGSWIDAVADLSFAVEQGEAVGLIGRNGAGKSTLLKLLSRVTRPTAGHADVRGRVGALLEVGTGFHPELTGRENTYLSGAILGMSRRDITARFDDIVAFAEIAPFIDMPVKHYSSGMYARLGFAVAAFLRPAILIVDEILAVGDLAFQAKCLAHMRQLSLDGTTVLFVSHNLLAMADFCPRALVMAQGGLLFDGPVSDAIGRYRKELESARPVEGPDASLLPLGLRVDGRPAGEVIERMPNDALRVDLDVDLPDGAPVAEVELNLVIEMPDGRMAIHLRNDLDGVVLRVGPGRTTLSVSIDDLALAPGAYTLWLRLVDLRADPPSILDTDRVPLHVGGDQRVEAVARPRHRFAGGAGTPPLPFDGRTAS